MVFLSHCGKFAVNKQKFIISQKVVLFSPGNVIGHLGFELLN